MTAINCRKLQRALMGNGIFIELVTLLGVSVLTVWSFKRMALPPILAYLFAGLICGPSGFGLITNAEQIHYLGELGIVLLLFSLGLEFSLPKMLAMRHLVFGVGLAQVLVTLAIFMVIGWSLGLQWDGAFVVASVLVLSSTAIVIKQISEMGSLHTRRAQVAVSILLFQDLAVVPFLIAIPILSGESESSITIAITMAVLKGISVLLILLAIGKWILPKVFSEVAQARTDELFVLTTLLVAVLAGGLTYSFGLSMALGGFMAGMMLGESQYRHQLEADIRPFRDILMGLFFTTVGMKLDLSVMISQIHWGLLGLLGMIVIKVLVIKAITSLSGEKAVDGWAVGIKLCQMGEFGFVLVSMALAHTIISPQLGTVLIGIGVISMAMTPFLVHNARKVAHKITKTDEANYNGAEDMPTFSTSLTNHAVIMGFGRVGQTVSRFLKLEAIPFIAVDIDPIRVQEAHGAGENVHFGDVRSKDIQKAVSVENARLILITFDDHRKAMATIEIARSMAPKVKILVRTRNDNHMEELEKAGANEVIPEKLEASMMMVSQVLFRSGVPVSRILRRLQNERRGHYQYLHGFFPGEGSQVLMSEPDMLEFLHAVSLPEDAFAIGKTLEDLDIAKRRVEIRGLRRDGEEITQPGLGTKIESQDILILCGKPRRIERVERYLLEGH